MAARLRDHRMRPIRCHCNIQLDSGWRLPLNPSLDHRDSPCTDSSIAPRTPRPRDPRVRNARLIVADLEARVVPSAPAPPPGFTATLTTFTNSTPVTVGPDASVVTSTIVVSGAGTYLHDVDLTDVPAAQFTSDLGFTLRRRRGRW